MADSLSRKLAVILHADIVGSTSLVHRDETLAHQRMRDAFRQFTGVIEQYAGIAHEVRGDALVAEFSRASDAVSASLAFQADNAARNEELDGAVRPVLRIGIAMGEVIIADNTLTGAGVVLAQRLEQLAEPGGVIIQGAAYETIPGRLPFHFRYLDEQLLKGFKEPVRAYQVSIEADGSVPAPENPLHQEKVKAVPTEKPAIAVLPFTNMSGDPDQEYFSDGISEDIITALSHFRSFPVISRNSTFSYKGQNVRAQQVAEELGARYVLEGGVRKAGERLRITAQLVDTASGHQVWANKFDCTIDDVFDIQDEMTQKIVTMIQPELVQAELDRAAVKRPENLSAWDLVLRGMSQINEFTEKGCKEAQKMFQQAIDLDPDYSDAWSGLAWSCLNVIIFHGPEQRQLMVDQGLKAARQAVRLDDGSSVAHYVLGMAYVWVEQFQTAITEVETSLQLNPYNPMAHMGLGNRLDLVGRSAEGIAKMEESLLLGPREPKRAICMALLCRAYVGQGNSERGLEWIDKGIGLAPDNPDGHFRRAVCLANLDRVAEARKALAECERLQPGYLTEREGWRPYSDEERNQRFFSGMWRHGLIKKKPSEK